MGPGADAIGVLFGDGRNGGNLDEIDRVVASGVPDPAGRPVPCAGMTRCRLCDGLISGTRVSATENEMVASLSAAG